MILYIHSISYNFIKTLASTFRVVERGPQRGAKEQRASKTRAGGQYKSELQHLDDFERKPCTVETDLLYT